MNYLWTGLMPTASVKVLSTGDKSKAKIINSKKVMDVATQTNYSLGNHWGAHR